MSDAHPLLLQHLDHALGSSESLERLRSMLTKISKCREAIQRQMNLADILHDSNNFEAFCRAFGEEEIDIGFQILSRMALEDYSHQSFTIHSEISGPQKFLFLYRSMGGWKDFDLVLSFHFNEVSPRDSVFFLNPSQSKHWDQLGEIPHDTLVTVHVRSKLANRSRSEEKLALERVQAIFETVEHANDEIEVPNAPIAQKAAAVTPAKKILPKTQARVFQPASKTSTSAPPRIQPKTQSREALLNRYRKKPKEKGELSMSFKVTINKMDTFVHAGNAHLITTLLKEYDGTVEMYVLRGEKQKVAMDADSIWGAEIRNGETVLYEFYGPKPEGTLAKELAERTNKYTQMDKIA